MTYYDANGNEVRRPWGLFKALMGLCVLAFVAVFVLQSWPKIQPYIAGLHLPATQAPSSIIVTATAATAAHPTPFAPYTPPKVPADPRTNPANQATAEAQSLSDYATAVAAAALAPPAAPATIPNVDNTGDAAPLIRMEKPAEERQPGSDLAATSEPLPQTQADDQFGSKPQAPIDIQATHQCLHGQVWTDSGCHYPTPVQ